MVEHGHGRRHHVGRQDGSDMTSTALGSTPAAGSATTYAASQWLPTGCTAATVTRATPADVPAARVDLAEFDALATDLDLEVDAADIFQCTLRGASGHPRCRRCDTSAPRRPRTGSPRTRPRSQQAGSDSHAPVHAPERYNSPVTPTGTGRNRASSTTDSTPRIGPPIVAVSPGTIGRTGIGLDGGLRRTVSSSNSFRPGAHRDTSDGGGASPPITTVARSRSPAGSTMPRAVESAQHESPSCAK